MLRRARDHHLSGTDYVVTDHKARALDRDDRSVRDICRGLDGDGFVALGIEPVSDRSDPVRPLAFEHPLHLVEHRAQALGAVPLGLHPQRPLDAVDGLEPVADQRFPGLLHATFELAGRALTVVVEVGKRPLVAILEPLELGAQLVAPLATLLAGGCVGLGFGVGRRLPPGVSRA